MRAYNRIIKLEAQNGAGKDRVGGEDEDGCDARCCRWLEGLPESVVVDKGAERRGGVWKRILGMISGGGGREGAGKGWTRWHGRKEVMRADGEA